MRRNVIDRLALLCTLHADGPRTLRLLREAGCTSIEKLGSLPAEKVAAVLGLPAAAARRLTREAVRLHKRLEPDLEREEITYPAANEARGIKPPPAGLGFDGMVQQRMTGQTSLDMRDQELMQRVVERWRSTDKHATQVEPEALDELLPDSEECSVEYFVPGAYDDALISRGPHEIKLSQGEVGTLRPKLESIGVKPADLDSTKEARAVELERLLPGDVEGLDQELCDTLALAGVRSLEELATCPADELTMRSGLPFTRARTLQFRAGKRLASIASQPLGVLRASEERLSPSERPVPLIVPDDPPAKSSAFQWDDGGAAGPFA